MIFYTSSTQQHRDSRRPRVRTKVGFLHESNRREEKVCHSLPPLAPVVCHQAATPLARNTLATCSHGHCNYVPLRQVHEGYPTMTLSPRVAALHFELHSLYRPSPPQTYHPCWVSKQTTSPKFLLKGRPVYLQQNYSTTECPPPLATL